MKKVFKLVVVVLVLFFAVGSVYAFKKYTQVRSKLVIVQSLMQSFCRGKDAVNGRSWMEDSTVYFSKLSIWDSTIIYYWSPENFRNNSPVYFRNNVMESVQLTDSAGQYITVPFDESFKTVFGKNVRKPSFTKNYRFDQASYNGAVIQAAFNEVYMKPTETIDGMLLSRVYNISIKEYARACTYVMLDVIKNKTTFLQQTNLYKTKAIAGKLGDGIDFCYKASTVILGKDYDTKKANALVKANIEGYSDRIVGMMMRRKLDGSLPVVMNCIKTVLKDYDTEFYETVKTKFVL